jgi:hypothetical protein
MFIIRRKTLHLDCFTYSKQVAETYPIANAMRYAPNWWKSLSASYKKDKNNMTITQPTMKMCYGFSELYKTGFILPLWTDIQINLNNGIMNYHSAMDKVTLTIHDPRDRGSNFDDYIHMKLVSPWFLEEKTGLHFLSIPCTWSQLGLEADINMVPGMLRFDSQISTNVNFFLNKNHTDVVLQAGLPLTHFIPLTDRTVKIHTHVLHYDEYLTKSTSYEMSRFANSFYHTLKLRGKK